MEWYFGSGVEDLLVPRDQDQTDRLPSPNSWPLWGISASESFGSMNNYSLSKKGKRLHKEVDMDLSASETEAGRSSNLSASSKGFQAAILYEGLDPESNDLAGISQMDDIFLNSLLEEEDPSGTGLCSSFEFFPEFGHGLSSADDLFSDPDPNHLFDMGISNSFKRHVVSSSLSRGEGEVDSPHFPHNSGHKDNSAVKEPLEKVSVSSELEIMNGNANKERSLELSVLQELEKVMAQLSAKTRICFRDALYRLANNSKQHSAGHSRNGNLILENPPPLIVHDETLRLENTEAIESETNVIDRTVANLMFCKMNSNAPELTLIPAVGLLNFKQEAKGMTGHCQDNLSRPQLPHCPQQYSCLAGDAEVPTFT